MMDMEPERCRICGKIGFLKRHHGTMACEGCIAYGTIPCVVCGKKAIKFRSPDGYICDLHFFGKCYYCVKENVRSPKVAHKISPSGKFVCMTLHREAP